MKNLLFLAAVVLLYTQLHASPTNSVSYSSGGSKAVKTYIITNKGSTTSKNIVGSRGHDDDDDDDFSHNQAKITTYSTKFGKNDDEDKVTTGHTTTVVKSFNSSGNSGKFGDRKDDDDDDDDKGCSLCKENYEKSRLNDDYDKLKVQSGHIAKTTVVNSSRSSNSRISGGGKDDDDDDDNHKGCSHGRDNSENDSQFHWGNSKHHDGDGKVKITAGQGQHTTTSTIVTSGDQKSGDHQNWHGEWHWGNSGHHDDDDKVKITAGQGQHTTTSTIVNHGDQKAGDHQTWHGELHWGNSGHHDGDDKVKVTNGQIEKHTTTTIVKTNNCEAVVKQLENANAEIVLLSQRNIALSAQSAQLSHQMVEYSTQILALKRQLQQATDDKGLCETRVNTITVELHSWKSKFEVTSITLKQVQEINYKLEITIKETQTTIIKLQRNIEQVTISNKNNDKELIEWKHKYDVLLTDSDSCKKQVKELTNSNNDLKRVNKELTEKLSCCQNDGHQQSLEIITIKSNFDNIKKSMAGCELEKTKLSDALKLKIKQYDDDEVRDHEELLLRTEIEADLAHWQSQFAEIEISYKAEKANVLNCKNEIVLIREELSKSCKKYESDIKILHTSIDQYKASLKSETDLKNSCVIENKKYVLHITDIEYQLNLSQKTVIEIQSHTKNCQDEANSLKITIDVLKRTISDNTVQLRTCGDHSNSIQIDLTACQSSKAECVRNFAEVKESLRTSETKIIELESENSSITVGNKRCESELSTLRCDTNHYLASVQNSYDMDYEKLLHVAAIHDKTKAVINNFVDTHNIKCNRS